MIRVKQFNSIFTSLYERHAKGLHDYVPDFKRL